FHENPDEVCEEKPDSMELHIKARNESAFPSTCFLSPEVYLPIYDPYNERVGVEYRSDGNNGVIIKALETPSGLVRIMTSYGVVNKELNMGGPQISCCGFGATGQA
ncbi:unnamed protein product, partial [marine sediment metagenome]